jgi:hypothetical protein
MGFVSLAFESTMAVHKKLLDIPAESYGCADKEPLSLKQLASYFKLPMEEACQKFNESKSANKYCRVRGTLLPNVS